MSDFETIRLNRGDDGKWHMHVAQFVGLCGVNQWATNSRVVHAVADAPAGPYQRAGLVAAPEHRAATMFSFPQTKRGPRRYCKLFLLLLC